MIAEPTHDPVRGTALPIRDERSMLVLELSIAGLALLFGILLPLAR